MKSSRPVAVVGGKRIPFVKSFSHYRQISNQQLLTPVLKSLVSTFHLQGQVLGDAALGSVIKSSRDWNLAREAILDSGLSPETPGLTLQRACGTSLEAALIVALKISNHQMESGIAGGSDTNSDLPVLAKKSLAWKLVDLKNARSAMDRYKILLGLRPSDFLPEFPGVIEPRTGKSMGEHCELMVKEWKISREDQDQLALASHQKAAQAYKEGFYDDQLIEFNGVKQDLLVRGDTSLEKLARLKPAFDSSGKGTLTAGNSTALTDGAAAVLLASDDFARNHDLPVLAHFVDAQVAAVDFVGGEGLLMAPTKAVSELLKRNQLTLQDFDFYEIHEAFAGQVLCTLKAWESDDFCRRKLNHAKALGPIDRSKLNIKGGSVALGHPFAATGARIITSLAKMLSQKGKGRGLISICTAGGMGVAAILEA